jgi:predicted PurR-regulated permease PerM
MVGPYLLAIATGGILAFMTKPLFRRLLARGLSAKLASLLVTFGMILLVIVPAGICIGLAVRQGITISHVVASSEVYSLRSIMENISTWTPIEALGMSPDDVDAKALEWIQSGVKTVTAAIISLASYLPNIFLQLALASITCFFLLMDGPAFLRWIGDKVPLDEDVRHQIVTSFKDTAIGSIWATLAASGAQSMIVFLGYAALGIPAPFLAWGASFVLAWIPVVGTTPVWAIGAFYLYTLDLSTKAVFMVLIGIFAGVIDNIIRPVVLKGRSDMHPLVSLLAIIGGVGLFGVLGVFFGPIIMAVLISLLQIWPAVAKRFRLIPASK